MSIAMFNTAKFQEKLIKAKVDPNVAKAQADVLYEAMSQNVDSLATKEQVDKLEISINEKMEGFKELILKTFVAYEELIKSNFIVARTDRETIRKEMAVMMNQMQTKMINWMFGSVGVLVTAGGIATAFILAK